MTRWPTTASSPATPSRAKPKRRRQLFDKLSAVGIDLPDVFRVLEDEGVEKFEKSWLELLEATQGQLDAAEK